MGVAVEVARRLGVPTAEVVEVAGGVANRAFRLGGELILRMPREERFAADLRKEVGVVPLARQAGVRTPAIVAEGVVHGAGGPSTPYVVTERVEGNDLADGAAGIEVWGELGRQIALLHATARQPIAGVPEDGSDRSTAVGELVERGYLDAGTADWLERWLDELSSRFDLNAPQVLLHGDLGRQNVMVRAGRFQALIDWGDAAWGPRAMEFAKLRLQEVAQLLPSYRSAAAVRCETGELEAEVLWFHLAWGVANLKGPPRPGQRHWTASPASRMLGALRFLTSSPPEPWPGLIKKVDLWD
ncbi:aminoglycoside phosphotransferase [Kribbella flavida DSM 17836]|uniref:Aminoglycoside phosphotransferase n=2 Tax=Kribbella flavida TaxID=182640 RepID=D2Q043_KRIFD|nr:aminoglycoside phosphotransferase family protein [Kribbella flavida]ADB30041.1 aminoglycoside phosphotransferase [Kribbella flavida DSM 17836]